MTVKQLETSIRSVLERLASKEYQRGTYEAKGYNNPDKEDAVEAALQAIVNLLKSLKNDKGSTGETT